MTLAIIDATYREPRDSQEGISASRYAMPLANVPLISHVLAGVAASGVDRARIIAAPGESGPLGDALAGASTLPVTVVDSPGVPGRRAVLAEIDAALGSDAVLLALGDGLHAKLLAELHTRFCEGDVDLVLSAGTHTTEDRGGQARLSETAVILGPQTRSVVAQMLAPGGDDVNLTELLLHAGLRLAVCDGSEGWAYDSSTATLLSGSRRVLDGLPSATIAEELTESNDLSGRVSIGHGVSASGCVVHGPVAIADDVVLEDSYIGPFTAIGASALISGTELDDSIVLPDAVIRHPGHRITASIIGEGVRVERSFELPRSVKLRLGPGSQVQFS